MGSAAGCIFALPGMEPEMFKNLISRFVAHIVQDVPAALAACEFGCPKGDCCRENWTNCQRRIAVQKCIELGDQLPNQA
jgi:hypothetical protein